MNVGTRRPASRSYAQPRRHRRARAIAAAKAVGEPAADLDATDLAEAILAHLEGPFVLAKARDEPAVLERLPRDIGRLATR